MKKRFLTLLTIATIGVSPFAVLAQESSSNSSSIKDELTEALSKQAEELQSKTADYLSKLTETLSSAEAQVNEKAEDINKAFTDYAQKLKSKIGEIKESEQLEAALQTLTASKQSIEDAIKVMTAEQKQNLSNQLMKYLNEIKPMLLTEDGKVNPEADAIYIELTWKLIQVAEKYHLIAEDAIKEFKELKLDFACAEFHRLIESSYNEDGTFSETLPVEELTDLYTLLKDARSDFVKEYQDQYDAIIKEAEKR